MPPVNQKALNLWTARVVPVVLVGIVGYSTWVIVDLVCVDYLLKPLPSVREPRRGTGITILVIYICLLLLLAFTYFRLVHTIITNPGYIPRGPQWHALDKNRKSGRRSSPTSPSYADPEKHDGDHDGQPTANGDRPATSQAYTSSAYGPASDVLAPGLHDFYKRDVFTCESDGRPIWCSMCMNWKLDRSHHCREVGRCVRKMDHFCPWVGGIVSENSQKFFVQFVTWGSIYCVFCLIFMAKFVAERVHQGLSVHWVLVLCFAALFSLFLVGMSGSSLQFVLLNTTTIENLSRHTKVWQLAIYLPNPPQDARPLPFRIITYGQPGPPPPSMSAQDSNPNLPPPPQPAATLRTFAILHSRPGDNPWDLGYFRNFQSVMGERWYDWLLPLKYSPCVNHDRMDCQFETGPVVERMRREAGILPASETAEINEKPIRHKRRRRKRKRRSVLEEPTEEADVARVDGERRRHRQHRRHRRSRSSNVETVVGR